MSKKTQLERQLKGQLHKRDESATVAPMLELLKRGKTAIAKATVNSNGDIITDHHRQKIAGVNGTIRIRDLLPDLLDTDGRVYRTPIGEDAGQQAPLSWVLGENSRAIEAGAILIPFPVTGETFTNGEVIAVREEAGEFITIEPATLEALPLDVNEEATVGATTLPKSTAKIDRNTLTQRAVRFSIPRSEQKGQTEQELSAQIMTALTLGIGRAVDAELLQAISGHQLNTFSLSNAAQTGAKFAELSAIIGTAGTGATTENGALFANGVKGEFSPTINDTVIGAFNRSAVAINDEISLLIERTNANGSLDVTAWLDMQALVPNPVKHFMLGV